jgi:hypothetical protein
MVQVISRWPLTVEVRDRALLSSCGIFSRQIVIGTGFSLRVLWSFPVSIIPLWLFMLIYQLWNEHHARWRPQIRDIVSRHRHDQTLMHLKSYKLTLFWDSCPFYNYPTNAGRTLHDLCGHVTSLITRVTNLCRFGFQWFLFGYTYPVNIEQSHNTHMEGQGRGCIAPTHS